MKPVLLAMLALTVAVSGCMTTITAPGVSAPISVSVPTPTRPEKALLSEGIKASLLDPPFGMTKGGWEMALKWFRAEKARTFAKTAGGDWYLFVFDAETRKVRGVILTQPFPRFETDGAEKTTIVYLVLVVEGDEVEKALWRSPAISLSEAEEMVKEAQKRLPRAV